MAAAPKLSVCIPLYNKSAYLEHCLGTVLAGNIDGMEVSIFDNGSTDGSSDIARQMAQRDSRIRYARLDHTVMVQESFRMALLHGRGELLKLHSADDELDPNFWSEMLPPLQDSKVDYTLCGEMIDAINVPTLDAGRTSEIYHKINATCRRIVAIVDPRERARDLILSSGGVNNLGNFYKIVFRRSCLPLKRWKVLVAGFPMPTSYPDWDFLVRLLMNHRGHYIDRILYRYRIMPDSPVMRLHNDPVMRLSDAFQMLLLAMTTLADPELAPLRATLTPAELQALYQEAVRRVTLTANEGVAIKTV